MGYYVRYSLEIKPMTKERIEDVSNSLSDLFGYVFDNDPWLNEETLYYGPYDLQKWAEHTEDMTEISVKHPDLTFKLECVGEDGEMWLEYFRNGKTECCQGRIVYQDPKEIIW